MRDALAFSENILLLEWLLELGDAKLSDEQRQPEIITNNGPGPRPSRGRKRPRMKSQTLLSPKQIFVATPKEIIVTSSHGSRKVPDTKQVLTKGRHPTLKSTGSR